MATFLTYNAIPDHTAPFGSLIRIYTLCNCVPFLVQHGKGNSTHFILSHNASNSIGIETEQALYKEYTEP